MDKREVLTIVKDWIHDLSYVNMEIDVTHEMPTMLEDTFKVFYMSSEFEITIREIVNSIEISINGNLMITIDHNDDVLNEDYYAINVKPLAPSDIRSLLHKLKYPPTEKMRSFCKGIEEWLSHLNNSTVKWYWYSPTVKSIGKCFKVQVGPFERLFHIENRDGGIVMDINYNQTIKYIDGVVSVTTPKPVQPFTIEEIKSLRDTIKNSMNINEKDLKIKRIEEILKQWLSDMTMTYTRGEHENEYLTCISSRPSHEATYAYIGMSIHAKEPCIWLYNTTNRIITFDPDNNWEPDMLTTYYNAYPFSNTNLAKLMAMYVKEFCGIDYEFRNKICFTVEEWLKRKSHDDPYYHNLTLINNMIKNVKWCISRGCYDIEWINNKWRLSRVMFYTYKRICDITPNGDINIGTCIGTEEKSLIDEIRANIKPTPDSTDEDLLASISKEYRTVTDALTDDFKQKMDERNKEYEELRNFIDSIKKLVEEDPVVISKSTADKLCAESHAVINTSDIIEKAKQLHIHKFPKVEIVKARPINEIRKDLKEAINGFKPDICYIDKIFAADVINIRKEETKMNIPEIKHVLFNETKKVTTVLFNDGTRVTSKAMADDEFDPEVGFAMCLMKKLYGNRTRFQKQIEKYHNAGIHRNKKIAEKAERKIANAEKASNEEI